jgi:hypothetical protein
VPSFGRRLLLLPLLMSHLSFNKSISRLSGQVSKVATLPFAKADCGGGMIRPPLL